MAALEILFWTIIALLFYCYIGYGLILYTCNQIRSFFSTRKSDSGLELLPVTLVIAAFNEESVIPQKIRNCREIDYPRDLLKIIFVTDGSTDNSGDLVNTQHDILALHQSKREGKFEALKRAMRFVTTPIVVFSDANSMLNPGCLRAIMRHYIRPEVGGVAGEKKISRGNRLSAVGQAEGLYWKYESFLKLQDSKFNTVIGAAGELFSIRTELFCAPDSSFILDDFILSMQVCLQGYKIEYEPQAVAIEAPSLSIMEEEKRKIRIAAGAFQSIPYLRGCMNLFRDPWLTIQYFSRRILRWVVAPVLIFMMLLINIDLVIAHQGSIYNYLLYTQVAFYVLALLGGIFVNNGLRMGILSVPFYFMFMNICLARGFFNYLQGRQSVLWEKSIREAVE